MIKIISLQSILDYLDKSYIPLKEYRQYIVEVNNRDILDKEKMLVFTAYSGNDDELEELKEDSTIEYIERYPVTEELDLNSVDYADNIERYTSTNELKELYVTLNEHQYILDEVAETSTLDKLYDQAMQLDLDNCSIEQLAQIMSEGMFLAICKSHDVNTGLLVTVQSSIFYIPMIVIVNVVQSTGMFCIGNPLLPKYQFELRVSASDLTLEPKMKTSAINKCIIEM